jgi:glycosyltransferase involved in cell wall biosynthesis
MKIAIFHNLEKGGALNQITSIIQFLSPNNTIDIYSFNENIENCTVNCQYFLKLKKTHNLFSHLYQIFFGLRVQNKKIAKQINKNNYDLILIFPCLLTQSPYVLRYIKKRNKCIYFFTEPKREFYEETSYDYFSIKKIITRTLRLPIKFIDKSNCKFAHHIISNSYYSAYLLKALYGKNSTVIYPGLKKIKPQKITIKNNKKILSVGLLSKIKGHDFTINQIKKIAKVFTLLGRHTTESNFILSYANKNGVYVNLLKIEDDDVKNKLYNSFSIYLANQNNEPFGITTLEATSNKCYVLGRNCGGTPEIVKSGVNGFLYTDIKQARKALKQTLIQKEITFYKIYEIDWQYTTDKIIEYYNQYIKHEPTE